VELEAVGVLLPKVLRDSAATNRLSIKNSLSLVRHDGLAVLLAKVLRDTRASCLSQVSTGLSGRQ